MFSKKHLIILDAIIIFGSLLVVFFIVGYTQPLAIAPLSSENENLLFTIPDSDYILIDDTSKFYSPETIFIDGVINLSPGRYFIKFFNGLSSEVRQIDIETDVVLKLKKTDDGLGIFNVGESNLLVDTYDTGSLTDSSLAYGGKDE